MLKDSPDESLVAACYRMRYQNCVGVGTRFFRAATGSERLVLCFSVLITESLLSPGAMPSAARHTIKWRCVPYRKLTPSLRDYLMNCHEHYCSNRRAVVN